MVIGSRDTTYFTLRCDWLQCFKLQYDISTLRFGFDIKLNHGVSWPLIVVPLTLTAKLLVSCRIFRVISGSTDRHLVDRLLATGR